MAEDEEGIDPLDLGIVHASLTQKKGPSEVGVVFNVGYGRATVQASGLVNTSIIPLVNEQKVLLNGKEESCGYYSHSSIDAYARCAKQFEFRYVKKEKPRLAGRLKMMAGTAVHDATEHLLRQKLEGKVMPENEYVDLIADNINTAISDFDTRFKKAKAAGEDPLALDYGDRITDPKQFPRLYQRIGSVFYNTELPKVNVVDVEAMYIHHFPATGGGTIPLVGFIDLIEKIDGQLVITDHKVGAKKTQAEADQSQQLALYSMAKDIPETAINSFTLGTTGGKSEKNPKPGEFVKYRSRKTIRDYRRVSENINAIMAGIKAGAFPRTGLHNPIVCSPSQCPYYEKCLGRG